MKLIFTYAGGSTASYDLTSEWTLVQERYENAGEEIEDPVSGRIQSVQLGVRWLAKVVRENSNGDQTFKNALIQGFTTATKVEVQNALHSSGAKFEVIPFNWGWMNERQFRGKLSEDSWAFELKSASLIDSYAVPKTVTITINSETIVIYGVEITESLREEVLRRRMADQTEREKHKSTRAILNVRMPGHYPEGYPDAVRRLLKARMGNHTMTVVVDGAGNADYFTSGNALTAVFDEEPILSNRRFYHTVLTEYELTFASEPLTNTQIIAG